MSVREASQRSNRSKARVEAERMEHETTLRRLQARGERLLQWFPELRKTWQRDAEPTVESLLSQLQSLGGQVTRRAQETGRDLEARAERMLADLERQAARGLGPLLSRANVASGSEVSDLEGRLRQLEERLAPIVERESGVTSALTEMRTTLDGARAEVSERFRETTMRLVASEQVHDDLGRVHEQMDALSKEQVSRSLEIGKLQDRLVRLELRMGDMLKEQAEQLTGQQEVTRRIGALEQAAVESVRSLQYLRGQVEGTGAEGRATDARLTGLISARSADHDELARLAEVLASIQQTLRQIDLRLGDLGERQAGVREELASLSARVSNLELAPTRPVTATMLTERTEGH